MRKNESPQYQYLDAPLAKDSVASDESLLLSELRVATRTKEQDSDSADFSLLDTFLTSQSVSEKLRLWLGEGTFRKVGHDPDAVRQQLDRDIALIDRLLGAQLGAVLQSPAFKKLESVWRGVEHLVQCRTEHADAPIQIAVLNATWKEIRDDQEAAVEFDQSTFFKKVYEEGLGQAGANPFSTLLMDFDIHPRPSKEHPFDDIAILKRLADTASAAFAPLYFNAAPAMFSVDHFDELKQTIDLESIQSQLSFLRWQQFRESEESRFVSLLLPRMLMRAPYRRETMLSEGFPYEENPYRRNQMLWGGAVWGMGEVLIRNFGRSKWFANIRGMKQGTIAGGTVEGPAVDRFFSEQEGVSLKSITEIQISDPFERQLARSGFTGLCGIKFGSEACFHSSPSTHKPRKYDRLDATANAELSSLTNYVLCACRFGHYVKLISRDQIGSLADAPSIQNRLNSWILDYVNRDPEASEERRAEKPLLEAMVQVRPKPGRPGEYDCVIQMEPYHTFDDVSAMIRLDTRLVTAGKN